MIHPFWAAFSQAGPQFGDMPPRLVQVSESQGAARDAGQWVHRPGVAAGVDEDALRLLKPSRRAGEIPRLL